MRCLLFFLFFVSSAQVSSLYGASIGNPLVRELTYDCSVTVYMRESVLFDSKIKASTFCSYISDIYSSEADSCFIRQMGSEFEANYADKKIFIGPESARDYVDWALGHAHKGSLIKHQVFYSGKCIDDYPIY